MINILGFSDKVHAISRACEIKSYYASTIAKEELIKRLHDEIPNPELKAFAEQLFSMSKDDDKKLIDLSLNTPKPDHIGNKLDLLA